MTIRRLAPNERKKRKASDSPKGASKKLALMPVHSTLVHGSHLKLMEQCGVESPLVKVIPQLCAPGRMCVNGVYKTYSRIPVVLVHLDQINNAIVVEMELIVLYMITGGFVLKIGKTFRQEMGIQDGQFANCIPNLITSFYVDFATNIVGAGGYPQEDRIDGYLELRDQGYSVVTHVRGNMHNMMDLLTVVRASEMKKYNLHALVTDGTAFLTQALVSAPRDTPEQVTVTDFKTSFKYLIPQTINAWAPSIGEADAAYLSNVPKGTSAKYAEILHTRLEDVVNTGQVPNILKAYLKDPLKGGKSGIPFFTHMCVFLFGGVVNFQHNVATTLENLILREEKNALQLALESHVDVDTAEKFKDLCRKYENAVKYKINDVEGISHQIIQLGLESSQKHKDELVGISEKLMVKEDQESEGFKLITEMAKELERKGNKRVMKVVNDMTRRRSARIAARN